METKIETPIKEGDILTLGIEKFGTNGDPMMIYKGYVIFLKDFNKAGVELNKPIKVKISKVFEKFSFAKREI